VVIRLTDERWTHISEVHAEPAGRKLEILEPVSDAERGVGGNEGELLALKKQGDGKTLVAVYREDANDGFIITAFLTRREATLNRSTQI
jgi:hypothetical protein